MVHEQQAGGILVGSTMAVELSLRGGHLAPSLQVIQRHMKRESYTGRPLMSSTVLTCFCFLRLP